MLILTCCFVIVALATALVATLMPNSSAYAAEGDVTLTGSVTATGSGVTTDSDGKYVLSDDAVNTATVTVTYKLVAKNSGMTSLVVKLTYDSDVFEIDSVTAGTIGGWTAATVTGNDTTASETRILWEGLPAFTGTVNDAITVTYKLTNLVPDTYTFGVQVLSCYTATNASNFQTVSTAVVDTDTAIFVKNKGTLDISAQTVEYNGRALKTIDSAASTPADAVKSDSTRVAILDTELYNYITYAYNGYGQTGAGTPTIKWYDSSDNTLASAPTNAGTYKVGVAIGEGTAYTAVAEQKFPVTIKPFDLGYTADDLTVTPASKPYTGSAVSWTKSEVAIDGDFAAPHATIDAVTGGGTAVGDCNLTVTVKADANFTMNGATGTSGDSKDITKQVSITSAENGWKTELTATDKTYDATAATVSAEANFGTVAYEYRVKGTETWASAAPVDAGTYEVRAVVEAGAGWQAITSEPVEYTISPFAIIVTPATQTVSYNGKAWTADGAGDTNAISQGASYYTVSVAGGGTVPAFVGNDDLQITLSNGTETWAAAGKYTLTVVCGNGNYSVTAKGDYNFEIHQDVTINSSEITFEYDGTDHTPVAASDAPYTFSGVTAQTNAGDYSFTATLKDTANTSWATGDDDNDGVITGTWTITKKAITVILPDGTLEYSDTTKNAVVGNLDQNETKYKDSEGKAITPDESLVLEYTFTFDGESVEIDATSKVGTYKVGAQYTSSSVQNYDLTIEEGTFTISKKAIKVSALSATVADGHAQKEYTGSAITWTSDDVTISSTQTVRAGITNVVELASESGSDIINANGYLQNGTTFKYYNESNKYYLTFALKDTDNYEFEGNPADKHVEVFVYRAANSVVTAPIVNMAEGDAEPTTTTAPVFAFGTDTVTSKICDDTAGTKLHTGEYKRGLEYYVVFTVAETNNYDGITTYAAFKLDMLTVAKPTVTIDGTAVDLNGFNVGTHSATYNGQNQTFTIPTNAGYSVTIKSGSPEAVTADTKDVGVYKFYVQLTDGYEWEGETTGTNAAKATLRYELTITKAALTLKLEDIAINLGETPEFTVTATGLVNGEQLEDFNIDWVDYVYCEYDPDNAEPGVYDIYLMHSVTPTLSDLFSNYDITDETATLTVQKHQMGYEGFEFYAGGAYDGDTHDIVMSFGVLTNVLFADEVNPAAEFEVFYGKAGSDGKWSSVASWTSVDYVYEDFDFYPDAWSDAVVKNVSDSGVYYLKFVDMGDELNDDLYIKIEIEITPIAVTATADPWTSKDGDDYTYTLTPESLPSFVSDELEFEVTKATTPNEDGTFDLIITCKTDDENILGNYDITLVNGTYTVVRDANSWTTAAATGGDISDGIWAKTGLIFKNAAFVSGTDYKATAAYGTNTITWGVYSDEDCKVPATLKDAGEYWIRAIIAETEDYDGLKATRKITIGKATIDATITLAADAFYNGEQQAYPSTITAVTANNGQTIALSAITLTVNTYDGSATAPKNVKIVSNAVASYAVKMTLGLGDLASNYDITVNGTAVGEDGVVNGTFKIKPAAITIVADDKTSVYGAEPVELTYSVTVGQIYNNDFTVSLSTTETITSTTAVEDYNIVITDIDNDNYAFTLTNGTYSVTKATNTVTLTISDDGLKYMDELTAGDGGNYNATATFGSSITYLFKAPGGSEFKTLADSKNADGLLDAGVWTVKASVADTDNYDAASDEKTLTIGKATVDAPTLSYNGGELSWSAVTGTDNGSIATSTLFKVMYKVNGGALQSDLTYTATATGTVTVSAVVVAKSDEAVSANFEIGTVTSNAAYSVTFQNTESAVVNASAMPATQYVFSGEHANATEAPTSDSHTFDKWLSGGSEYIFATATVTADLTLDASWNIRTFTVTWKNDDSVLLTQTVNYGVTPTYTGATPTKEADAEYTYTFDKWDPTPAAITEDTAFVATYTKTANFHTVKYFLSIDGGEYAELTGEGGEFRLGTTLTHPTQNAVTWFRVDAWYTDENRTTAAPSTMGSTDLNLYGSYVFDIGAGDVNGDGSVNADDIALYRQNIVGGHTMTVIAKGTEWTYIKGGSYSAGTTYFFERAADVLGDSSMDIRDISQIRMAIVGGYGVEIVTGGNVTGAEIATVTVSTSNGEVETQSIVTNTDAVYESKNEASEPVAILCTESEDKRSYRSGN